MSTEGRSGRRGNRHTGSDAKGTAVWRVARQRLATGHTRSRQQAAVQTGTVPAVTEVWGRADTPKAVTP